MGAVRRCGSASRCICLVLCVLLLLLCVPVSASSADESDIVSSDEIENERSSPAAEENGSLDAILPPDFSTKNQEGENEGDAVSSDTPDGSNSEAVTGSSEDPAASDGPGGDIPAPSVPGKDTDGGDSGEDGEGVSDGSVSGGVPVPSEPVDDSVDAIGQPDQDVSVSDMNPAPEPAPAPYVNMVLHFDDLQFIIDTDMSIEDGSIRAVTEDGVRYVTLMCDVTRDANDMDGSIYIGYDGKPRSVRLDLNGYSIDAVQAGSVIDIARNSLFILEDDTGSGKVMNGKAQNVTGGSDAVKPNGTGGGVRIQKGARFEMYGGSIENNSAAWGAGVEVQPDAVFVMYGGSIQGNEAGDSGGGVNLDAASRFDMYGGSITGNTSATWGGGVHINRYCSVIVHDGDISSNTAMYGGGVSLGDGTFELLSGSVTGNTATGQGGGVYYSSSWPVTDVTLRFGSGEAGGTASISGNNAKGGGGGVYIGGAARRGNGGNVFVDVGVNSVLSGNTAGTERGRDIVLDSAQVCFRPDADAVPVLCEPGFWFHDVGSRAQNARMHNDIRIEYPKSDMSGLGGHVLPDASGTGHIRVSLFDYDTGEDGRESCDTRFFGEAYPDTGVNAGRPLKFGGVSGYSLYEGKGIVGPLLENGYPVFSGKGREPLDYLFDGSTASYKRAYYPENTMFLRDGDWFEFDSMRNFVEYDEDANRFVLYDQPGVYWHDPMLPGQFFPFSKASDVFYTDDSGMYAKYVTSDVHLTDSFLDHYFGVKIDVDFTQIRNVYNPKTGQMDPARFEFSGDDDIWVFIDGVLVLDIGGVHGRCGGYIDFSTGEVSSPENSDDGADGLYRSGTIRALYELALGGAFDAGMFDGDTFVDGTDHTMQVFYLERGNWASNFSMRFNLYDQAPVGIRKVDGDTGIGLSGVVFGLYSDMDCTHPAGSGLYASDSDGYLSLASGDVTLMAGEYWLKEQETLGGYVMDMASYRLTVNEDGTYAFFDESGNTVTELKNYAEKADDDSGLRMPLTGGPGVAGMTAAGSAMILAALLVWKKRQRRS